MIKETLTPNETRRAMLGLEAKLQSKFIKREEEIRGLTLAALSRTHILLLGPPGTAKTNMVSEWSKGMSLSMFRRLIGQYTTPDEIFGPVDIQALKQGEYRRILRGKAADSQVVFLDEVFKAGPAILNTMLGLMEEREFDNDGMVVKTPLVTLIGASNEIPTDEDNLGAFYDRFLIRYVTRYIEDDRDFVSMLKGSTTTIDSMLTEQDLLLAQIEVDNLPMSPEAYESVKIVWETLREDEGIFPSDRRFVQLLRVMAADSWLKDYNEIKAESVLVGQHILWTNPDQISQVKRVVINGVNPNLAKAEEILSAAKEALAEAMRIPTPQPQDLETMSALQEMLVELSNLSGVTTIYDQVVGMRITLGNKLSG